MSSLGTSKMILEIAKFGVYVAVPVSLTYLVATDSKTLKMLMGLRPYVVYPPEGPRPPPPEELCERAREIAEARKRQHNEQVDNDLLEKVPDYLLNETMICPRSLKNGIQANCDLSICCSFAGVMSSIKCFCCSKL